VADDHDVVVLDDLSSGKREQVPGAANLYQMDLDSRWIGRVIGREKPDAVCHLAAQISVSRSVREPLFDAHINVMGSLALIEACRRHGVKRFVFTSTGGAIYGDTETLPTPEDHPARPMSPYGASKLSVEHYLNLYQQLDGFSSIALRLANVYGPRQDPHGEAGVVAIFSRALLDGKPATVNGDGLQTRDYIYVGDVVEAFASALKSDARGSVNIGTAIETNVVELYELIRRAARSDQRAAHGPARPGEQRRSCIAIARAAATLGWKPKFSLEEGVAQTVDYFRQHPG
jgi:UDP-glucose 4-epimerase